MYLFCAHEIHLKMQTSWGLHTHIPTVGPACWIEYRIQKICSAHISTLLGAQGANPETPGQAPSLSRFCKCPGFFYVHYTTHGTYSFTSHPKDEAIMVKCLAQGHKRRDRPGRYSNPHSDNIRTWVQCTKPLGHDNLSIFCSTVGGGGGGG